MQADLLLSNAKVWTGEEDTFWDGVAIGGDKILAVGSMEHLAAFISNRTTVLDLAGKLVLPGFIDNHTHFMMGGFYLMNIDLRSAGNIADFVGSIGEKAKHLQPGRWLTGGNWDNESWPGAALPQKEQIDPVTPDIPVFVTRLDLHMGLANSLALMLAGITFETPDPPGGMIVRHPETGEPTGILKDAAMDMIRRAIPQPSERDIDEAMATAMQHAAQVGVTSVQDVTSWQDLEVFRKFHRKKKLTVRIYARVPITEWEQLQDCTAAAGAGDDWLRLGGVKGFADGSLGSSTALFFEPYCDEAGFSGLLHDQMLPAGAMKKLIFSADSAGLQLSLHAIGDKANHIIIDYLEELIKKTSPRDRRPRIEHAQHLLPSDINRLSANKIIASCQPYHAIDDGRWAERKIGQRCRDAFPYRSLLNSGTILTFGTDWPVAPLNPLLGIYAAVTRRTLDGKNSGGWYPEQKITLREALKAYTLSSAYAEFAENKKGLIAPGKLADMVVLSRDIFTIDPAEIPDSKVALTIVGGRIVFSSLKN